MTRVELSGIGKSFGDVIALAGVDLEIGDGENLAILGPSGSGKSTLLRVIAGLEQSDCGAVLFDGRDQAGIPAHRRDSAIVFQHFALYPHLSSLDNITLGLRHGLGLSKAESLARAREIAARMQVEQLLGRRPREMSGGQRQRIALARALARRSGVVLLDEPLSGLDAQLHAILRLEIAELLRSAGATGINVTHDQLDAMAMADRIAVINHGRIEQVGTPDELYATPASTFVAGFIGTPPMNLLPIDPERGTSAFGEHRMTSSDALTLGIRAEDLRLSSPDTDPADDDWRLSGTVALIEPTGRDRIVHLTGLDGPVALRCDHAAAPAIGERVVAGCRQRDVHVYASDSGRRLGDAATLRLDPIVPVAR